MGDIHYGLQISQRGIPLDRAADYQKVIDDRWPFLDVAFDRDIDISKADWPVATQWWTIELLRHDLGYIPAYTFRESTSLIDSFGNTRVIATKTSVFLRGLFVSGDPTTPIRIIGKLRVFALDITKEFKAPIRHYAVRPDKDPEYGVKVLKPGNSRISARDMSKFSINTQSKALSVQQTGLVVPRVADGHLIINHDIGYPPTFMIAHFEYASAWSSPYADPTPGENRIKPLDNRTEYGSILAKSRVTTTQLDLADAQSALYDSYGYVIIKDPIEVAR